MNRSVSASITSAEFSLRFTLIARDHCPRTNGGQGLVVERSERFSVISSVVHKVIRPNVVPILRLQTNARTVVQPEPSFLRLFHWYFEPLMSPQAFDTLVVDLPSGVSEQSCDPTVAVTTILARQFDHVGHQAVFISAANWQPPLC
jgi:hypothetical protein